MHGLARARCLCGMRIFVHILCYLIRSMVLTKKSENKDFFRYLSITAFVIALNKLTIAYMPTNVKYNAEHMPDIISNIGEGGETWHTFCVANH